MMKAERVRDVDLCVGDRVLIPNAGDGLAEWTMGEHGLRLSCPPRHGVQERLDALAAAQTP